MKPSKQLLGQKGEQQAVDFLKKYHYKIIARNYRYSRSEIDIICCQDDVLIFCEVKSYQSKPLDAVEFRVNKKKQEKLIQGAYGFIEEYPEYENYNIRFDVIIVAFSSYPVDITHHKAAFWLEEPF
ncbi:MAG: YraN family protein [Calditrichaceae bacterium]|jgi:putative endonuclease